MAWPASWIAVASRSRSDMVRFLRSMPIMIRSQAYSKSGMSADDRPWWTACEIAVLTRFETSAPVKPGVILASFATSTASLCLTLPRKNSNKSFHPPRSGFGMWIFLSNLPGLIAA